MKKDTDKIETKVEVEAIKPFLLNKFGSIKVGQTIKVRKVVADSLKRDKLVK